MSAMTFDNGVQLFGGEPARPVNPVFVLSNGIRVGMDLRYQGEEPCPNGGWWHVWVPIIEGDTEKLMPMISGVDADEWPRAAALKLPRLHADDGANHEWMQRILRNSPVIHGVGSRGTRYTRG